MRLLLYSPLLIVFFYSNLFAQTPTETTHFFQSAPTRTGSSEKQRIKNMYRFPVFTDAEVFLQNGDTATGQFNYNISMDQMHYIGLKNDTLYVADPVSIKFIKIDSSRFYYFKDYYLQSLLISDNIVFAFRQTFFILAPSSGLRSMSVKSYADPGTFNYYTAEGKKHKLTDDKNLPLASKEHYYFGDKYGNFFPADKNFILDHYPNHQPEIRSYIKVNHLHFDNKADILKLLQYCGTLNK
jgi:hypothetical protein